MILKKKRQQIVKKYLNAFNSIKQIELLDLDYDEILPHIFVIKVKQRDQLKEYLQSNNIECGIHWKPNHKHKKYKENFSLPVTEKIYKQILTLPCHYDLTNDEQKFVIDNVRKFFSK